MQYLQTIIITGGDEKSRREKIDQILTELKIHPVDITTIDPEKSIGIEDVRNLRNQLFISPVSGEYKAIIFYSFQKATTQAQNALLKTFEEPPKQSFLIAETDNTNALLPTITSRAQIIRVKSQQSQKENTFDTSEFTDLLKAPLGQKMARAESLKTKEDALLFIDQAMLFFQHELKNRGTTQVVESLKKLQKARMFIEGNVNPRLTIEILLINLKYP